MNLIKSNQFLISEEIDNSIDSWLDKTVSNFSIRSEDIRRDKSSALIEFFNFIKKTPEEIKPIHIKEFRRHLQSTRKLSEGTIYNRISFIANYFDFLLTFEEFKDYIKSNPVTNVRPKAPKPYVADSTKSLKNKEILAMENVIKKLLYEDKEIYYRDFAIFELLITTGMRRSEIAYLKGKNIEFENEFESMMITVFVKGGKRVQKELRDETAIKALIFYLKKYKRFNIITKRLDESLFLATDNRVKKRNNKGISDHALAERMKYYAELAGIKNFTTHQLRHTFARIVADDTGSLNETQEALGHAHLQTTRHYVDRIKTRRDKYSKSIRNSLESS